MGLNEKGQSSENIPHECESIEILEEFFAPYAQSHVTDRLLYCTLMIEWNELHSVCEMN